MAQERTHHFSQLLLTQGWARDVRVSCRDGLCTAVETGVKPGRHDERHAIGIPGMPNLHSHAFQRGMAGMAERRGPADDSFWTWREVMYRFVDRLSADDLQAIAALAYAEMMETGFTRVAEFHYLHHDVDGRPFADIACMTQALVDAASDTGIGLTLLPVFYAHAGFGGLAAGPGQRRFICGMDQFARLMDAARDALKILPDGVLGVAPHSLRAVTPDELRALLDMMPAGPVHIHIAEQVREIEDCLAWSNARPVEWLLDNHAVDGRWCLVHATHMTDIEARDLAGSGAVAGLCPITEANLGDGIFNAAPFLVEDGRYGIGSDSNILIDPAEELRLLEYGQRLHHRGRNLLSRGEGSSTGAAIFNAALAGGGQASGVEAAISIGSPLDFVSLDPDHPSLAGKAEDALLDGWVFAAGRGAVHGVWRRGEQRVSNGRHRARPVIEARYRRVIERLMP